MFKSTRIENQTPMMQIILALLVATIFTACSDSDIVTTSNESELNSQLRGIIDREGLTGDPSSHMLIPNISDELPQLGMKLFFSKSLGGDFDSACASCHHPGLGGDDDLSLSIGVDAVNSDLLGRGRTNYNGDFPVPRNAPTTFNAHLFQTGLFWDSRVEQLVGGISTPDSGNGSVDASAGDSLLMAQAKFPVTSVDEMKGSVFENGSSNDDVRGHLAARVGGYDGGYGAGSELLTNNWLIEFQTAFGSPSSAESLITPDNIAFAIAEYQKSQVFVDTDWKAFVQGDDTAISVSAKRGAILFYTRANQGGADCSRCHSGDLFSDELHHVAGFPQIGPGKGDGSTGNEDFGRGRETGQANDRYRFRTPSLLNVALTAPYGHAGAYGSLEEVVRHYERPQRAVELFDDSNWCQELAQFSSVTNCASTFPNAQSNTQNAVSRITGTGGPRSLANINIDEQDIDDLVAFMESLTDGCIIDSQCISRWVPSGTGPDNMQLNAVDRNSNPL